MNALPLLAAESVDEPEVLLEANDDYYRFVRGDDGEVSILDVHDREYVLYCETVGEPLCSEAEDRFCYHDPDTFTHVVDAELRIRVYEKGFNSGFLEDIHVKADLLVKNEGVYRTAIIIRPSFLMGFLCSPWDLPGLNKRAFYLDRPFCPEYFGDFMDSASMPRDGDRERRFVEKHRVQDLLERFRSHDLFR